MLRPQLAAAAGAGAYPKFQLLLTSRNPRNRGLRRRVTGEPGIGKSRLVEEFRGQLADRRHSRIEWSSSQLLQNTPLHPILGWGRVRFGGPEVAPERRLAELESLLADVQLDAGKLARFLQRRIEMAPRDAA